MNAEHIKTALSRNQKFHQRRNAVADESYILANAVWRELYDIVATFPGESYQFGTPVDWNGMTIGRVSIAHPAWQLPFLSFDHIPDVANRLSDNHNYDSEILFHLRVTEQILAEIAPEHEP